MLDAENARKVTRDSLKSDTIIVKPYVNNIGKRILEAAGKGKREIIHPFAHHIEKLRYPSQAVEDAVREAVEYLGYTWTDHPDPDPGDPRGGPYTTISW